MTMQKLWVPCSKTLSPDALLFAVGRSLDRWGTWTMKLDRPTPVLACAGNEGSFEVHCHKDPSGDGLHLSVSEKRRSIFNRLLGASATLARLTGDVERAATEVVGPFVKALP
jgi:hypothetical protein